MSGEQQTIKNDYIPDANDGSCRYAFEIDHLYELNSS